MPVPVNFSRIQRHVSLCPTRQGNAPGRQRLSYEVDRIINISLVAASRGKFRFFHFL